MQLGLHCGGKWGKFAAASRGGGAPPTPPPRLDQLDWSSQVAFRGTFDHTLDAKNRLTVPARYRAALSEGVVLAMPVDLKPYVGVWRPQDYERYTERSLAELPPLSSRLTELERFFYGSSHDADLDAAGRIMVPASSASTRSSAKRSSWWGPATAWSCGIAPAGTNTDRRCSAASQRSQRALTILLDMTTVHIPVLAEELLELLDLIGSHPPRPSSTALSAAAGTRALIAERLGSQGTLVAIDRDPFAEERFLELAQEIPCSARFIRGDYAEGLEMLSEEGVIADAVYFDLGMSSMQIDTRERGFSYSYDAPLDMRMDPRQELTAREIVATWDERRLAGISARVRRGAPRRSDRPRDRARSRAVSDRNDARARGGHHRRDSHSGSLCRWAPRQAHVSGSADRRQRRAGTARSGAAACLGAAARGRRACRDLLSLAGGQARQALPRRARSRLHLPARPARVRLWARARGGAAHTWLDRALGRGDGAQPPRLLGASACRHKACRSLNRSRRSSMTPPATARSLPKRAAPDRSKIGGRRAARVAPDAYPVPVRPLARVRWRRRGRDPGAGCRATARAPARDRAHPRVGARRREQAQPGWSHSGHCAAWRAVLWRASVEQRFRGQADPGTLVDRSAGLRLDRDRRNAAAGAQAQHGHRPHAWACGDFCSAKTLS